jgi:hypothetical protein
VRHLVRDVLGVFIFRCYISRFFPGQRRAKKGHSTHCAWNAPLNFKKNELDDGNVHRRGTFLALLDFKRDSIAFVQGLESVTYDTGKMDEYIRTIFLLDKTVAFAAVKPLDNSIGHCDTLLP